jgi:hypothetical protein
MDLAWQRSDLQREDYRVEAIRGGDSKGEEIVALTL